MTTDTTKFNIIEICGQKHLIIRTVQKVNHYGAK